jgi:hypothetical protein
MAPGYAECGMHFNGGPSVPIETRASCSSKNHKIVLTRKP